MSTIVRQSVWSSAILLLLAPPTLALAQRVYHEDFEKIKTSWTFEKSDASYQLLQHDRGSMTSIANLFSIGTTTPGNRLITLHQQITIIGHRRLIFNQ